MKPACVIPIGVMAMALAVSASAQNAGSSSVARAVSGPRVTGVTIADAAMKRDLAAGRALLRQKADVNATQADGATALH